MVCVGDVRRLRHGTVGEGGPAEGAGTSTRNSPGAGGEVCAGRRHSPVQTFPAVGTGQALAR